MASPIAKIKANVAEFKALEKKDRNRTIKEFLINNSLYFILIIALIIVQIMNPNFLALNSLVNIISLSAANIPIALGVAGCIVLTGTDLSAGRIVGLTACITASLLQAPGIASKMYPDMNPWPIILVFIVAIAVSTLFGFFNGFCTAKFNLHPFIVTLATQLIVYGILLMYLMNGSNNGMPISGLSDNFINFIKGSVINIGTVKVPNYIFYAIIITVIMWFVWNKTVFGKNMFAVGSNPEAANVSGVNVTKTIIMVFALAGLCYGITGFIESARIGSNSSMTGLNYELDAIAACVIGGVSFVGGIGKIRGVIVGVVLLRLIFVALNVLSIDANMQYIIKGLIILVACAIDMRKYLVRK